MMTNEQKFELVLVLVNQGLHVNDIVAGINQIDQGVFSAVTVEQNAQSINISIPLGCINPA